MARPTRRAGRNALGRWPLREPAPDLLRLGRMTRAHSLGTVLIVDDEPSLLDVLAFVLGGEGYRVTTAPDGNAALHVLEAQSFDFIVSDYMMPGTDGLGVFKALRARGDDTFFVLMTSLPLDKVPAVHPACNAYLQKPFGMDALLAQLR